MLQKSKTMSEVGITIVMLGSSDEEFLIADISFAGGCLKCVDPDELWSQVAECFSRENDCHFSAYVSSASWPQSGCTTALCRGEKIFFFWSQSQGLVCEWSVEHFRSEVTFLAQIFKAKQKTLGFNEIHYIIYVKLTN